MPTSIQKFLFVDTNIFLDMYRSRSESALKLLEQLETIKDKVIVTHQLETEFKKNRQTAILEGLQELKSPQQVQRLGIFSDAQAIKIINRNMKQADTQVKKLKARLSKALANPSANDPVFQICQRIFHRTDNKLVLDRENPLRHSIRRQAFKRFLHGCPPRKKNDTSIGDAINWEWMVHCAEQHTAGLIIVSRDSDYGVQLENKAYINDHLQQEFSDRVSRKRKLLLYTKLSEALKHFEIQISPQEEKEEQEAISEMISIPKYEGNWSDFDVAFRRFLGLSDDVTKPSDGSEKIKNKDVP